MIRNLSTVDRGGGGRRGFTLVEVIVAALVLAALGLSVQHLMVSVLKGLRLNRETEAKRHLIADLLERLCHPYTDVASLFPDRAAAPAVRELDLKKALDLVGISDEERPGLEDILRAGKVRGVTLVWHPGLERARGGPDDSLRLDELWVHLLIEDGAGGPQVDAFRIFSVRGDG